MVNLITEFVFDEDADDFSERKQSKDESQKALESDPKRCMVQPTWIRPKIKFNMATVAWS